MCSSASFANMPSTEARSIPPLDPDRSDRLHRLAHDLKNRIGGVLEAVRLLHERPEGTDPAEISTFAERNLFRALRDIESALDDLGVERGPAKIQIGPVDLTGIVKDSLADVRPRFMRKEQDLIAEVAEDMHVTGDAELMRQVVHGLLTNASKFSNTGATIRCAAFVRDGQAIVRIDDPGSGLTPEDLEDLFVRYAWLSSRSTAGEGQARSTLARARHWVESHHGSLEAESEGIGKGARFTLRLPLR